jgi:hypothetical protein
VTGVLLKWGTFTIKTVVSALSKAFVQRVHDNMKTTTLPRGSPNHSGQLSTLVKYIEQSRSNRTCLLMENRNFPLDITYEKRKAIKSQILTDFTAEWLELQNTGPPNLSGVWTM